MFILLFTKSQSVAIVAMFAKSLRFCIWNGVRRCKKIRELHSYSQGRVRRPTFNIMSVSKFSVEIPPKCWKCEFPFKSELFCSRCRSLQKLPATLNYFDIIGVQNDYNISIEEVRKKYRDLQRMLHPDKFTTKSNVSVNIYYFKNDKTHLHLFIIIVGVDYL